MEEDGGRREKVFSWRSSGIGLMCLCQEDRYPSTRGRGGTATSISMPLRLQTAKKMCDTKRGGQKSGKQRKVGERRRERKRGGEKGAVLGSGYRATEGGPNLDRRIPRTRGPETTGQSCQWRCDSRHSHQRAHFLSLPD